jgi:hypothetical protein
MAPAIPAIAEYLRRTDSSPMVALHGLRYGRVVITPPTSPRNRDAGPATPKSVMRDAYNPFSEESGEVPGATVGGSYRLFGASDAVAADEDDEAVREIPIPDELLQLPVRAAASMYSAAVSDARAGSRPGRLQRNRL